MLSSPRCMSSREIAKMCRIKLAEKIVGLYPYDFSKVLFSLYIMESKRNPREPELKAYFDSLPTDYSMFPMFFSPEERKFLKGSRILDQIDLLDYKYFTLYSYLKANLPLFCPYGH